MRLTRALVSAVLLVGAYASNVQVLNPGNFDSVIGKGKPALVEFYAPWCGHCKNLEPIYDQLADAFLHAKDKVIIAKVDADGEGKPLGTKYDVAGYPTLKWFNDKGKEEPYDGDRSLEGLASFVTSKTGVKSNITPPPPPAALTLNVHNFEEVVMNTGNNVLVSFTAPWCGHCKSLKPIFEKVAKAFKPESGCIVANVDADAALNKPLAEKYGITGYPTLKFFSKDNKESPLAYEGGRDEASFVAYLNEKCGTQRAVGGGLNDEAGRIAALDALAHKFVTAGRSVRDSLFKEASTLASSVGAASKHYLRVMERLINGSEDYLEKEMKRLNAILDKRSLAQSKLDELKIKMNILGTFLKKGEEGEKGSGRAGDEL